MQCDDQTTVTLHSKLQIQWNPKVLVMLDSCADDCILIQNREEHGHAERSIPIWKATKNSFWCRTMFRMNSKM